MCYSTRRDRKRERERTRLVVVRIRVQGPRDSRSILGEENIASCSPTFNFISQRDREKVKHSSVLRQHLVYWDVNSRFYHLPTFFFTRQRGENLPFSPVLLIINRANEEAFVEKTLFLEG